MLVISQAQMDALAAYAGESFHERLVGYVHEVLPDHMKQVAKRDLETLIVNAETRARGYGVTTQRGIAKWVCMALMAGQTFDEIPEVRLALTQAKMDVERQLDVLLEALCHRASGVS
jgi:hypothetical protein